MGCGGHLSREAIAKAGELGFCGLYTPEQCGSLGLSRLDAAVVFEELASVDPSTAAYISIHNMATWMVSRWGTPALCGQWVARLAAGKLASYCLTEPQAGSDAASLRPRAERRATITCSTAARPSSPARAARTAGGDGAYRRSWRWRHSALAVPADTPGISFGKKEEKMGWNSQPTRTITSTTSPSRSATAWARKAGLCNCHEGAGWRPHQHRRLLGGHGAGGAGARRNHMKERAQFGGTGEFQALQFKLADMVTELVAAPDGAAGGAEAGPGKPDASVFCAMAKRFATDTGFNVANDALQLHGGYGYIREYPLERHVRDTRVHQILEGTNEIMRVIVGGHPATALRRL
jgi:alkylation response protein AidB-like acyl-CoA dehydrogenase